MTAESNTVFPADTISPEVAAFFDEDTFTFSYVVKDPNSNACAIIDSVLNFDYNSAGTTTTSADQLIAYVKEHGLNVQWHIETHVHADHLSAAPYLQAALGGKIGISEHIVTIQETFGTIFNEGTEFQRDGSQFDALFTDNETYHVGTMACTALHTPGHTPACMTHIVGDAVFVGDTLFMPDAGTARADFPGGSAHDLYLSVQRILSLPANYRLFMCHDYGPDGRPYEYETNVKEQRLHNIHVNSTISEAAFITMREARDKTLGMPHLILPSLQVNMRAGHFPEPEDNQQVYLKIPVNAFK